MGLGGWREGILWRLSGEVGERAVPDLEADADAEREREAEAVRPMTAALAPGGYGREIFEALWEGGPWKSDGGGRRAEIGESGFGFGFAVRVGDVCEMLEACRSRKSSAGQPGPESGEKDMLLGESGISHCKKSNDHRQ